MKEKEATEDLPVKLKRVSFLRLLWFTRLNMEIHKKDPIFKKALASRWEKFKFTMSFCWRLARQKRFILVRRKDVIGALSLEKRKLSIFIYAIGILPSFYRQGFGTKLMLFTEEFAKKNRRKFVCFSVLLENIPAVSLYKKLGYHSQGIGLTLIRFLRRKLSKSLLSLQETTPISLYRLSNPAKKRAETFHWWYEEIAAISEEAKQLCIADKLLDFKLKPNWDVYQIKTGEETVGVLVNIPSSYIPTLMLLSSPKATWTKNCFLMLLSVLQAKFQTPQKEKPFPPSQMNSQMQNLFGTSSIYQFFLTQQHKDHLLSVFGKEFILHDPTEDRQIFFKRVA
ncbi:MAG: hypothetical protein DRP02_08755 [Candidatus Gerdarchaeota archaeon]|nr:MAG: hypothetical protein DRP02_08755 [Candidatus Gerdarchaeota archaeon]